MNYTNYDKSFKIGRIWIFLLLALFIGESALAQQSKERLTPQHVAKTKSVSDVIIAPNGNRLAYTLTVQANPMKENKPSKRQLYLMDLVSGESTPFVTTMSVSSVQFRPGNNALTFLGRRSDDKVNALYQISLEGGEPQKLFSFETSIAAYNWAPDGNHLAYMAADPSSAESTSELPYKPEIYEENLTQRRGYVTNVSMEGHEPHRVAMEGSVYQMKWSPDGEKIAIAIAPTPLIDDYYMHQQVKIVDNHGEEVLAEVNHQGKLGQIEWSPDSNLLAMIAGADIHDPIDGRLFVVSADGGTPNNIKPDFQGMFEHIQWANNKTLNYLASEGVWSTYGKINSDGSGMQTIVGKGQINLSDFSRSKNANVAFVGDSPSHPAEVFLMKNGQKSPKRMTDSNEWLKNIELGEQEVVTWTARDGKELQGLLIHPVNASKDSTYPLVTVVHGGPESHYNNGWLTGYSQPGQVAAGKGYYVFYPNYRGSTGRGVAFAKSSQGDLAGAEFDDIVDGVDEFVEAGIAHPDKIGVTGGSYGGYATGWMATRYTDRFAAGVMFVGISDNISKWGTSDIPEELYLVHARQRIWEDYQYFLERSPIYYAGQAETPLLIMAGKEDTRVDPGQSYELYRHIKTRTDTPVRLVLYPGEGHGNTQSTARFDYNVRMMRWFDQYLKGEEQRPDTEIEVEAVDIQN
ncbi:MAG: S9 family peptidase [Balneolaceae bacterium]|nr:S9 family peptidase [Balneolaceae bacterium]